MGQPIHCDATSCDQLADVLVSRITPGQSETTAWCDPHYVLVCQAIAEAVSASEADAAAQDATDRLEGATAPTGNAMTEDQLVAAHGGLPDGPDPMASAESSDAATVPPGEPGQPDSGQPEPELTEGPAETVPAPVGRSRRSRGNQAGDTVPA